MTSDRNLRDARLAFYKSDIERIEKILDSYLTKSEAKCALLIDKDGHMITSRGNVRSIDTDTISALVAGSFAATREMARLIGEKEFTALFHQGRSDNIQLSIVGDRALLTTIFDERTTVGKVRLYTADASKRLAKVFTDREKKPASAEEGALDPEFGSGASKMLDDVLGG